MFCIFLQFEATEVFFSVTKLFQSKEIYLRRMVYLMIKELSPSSDEVTFNSMLKYSNFCCRDYLPGRTNLDRGFLFKINQVESSNFHTSEKLSFMNVHYGILSCQLAGHNCNELSHERYEQ